MWYKEKLRRRPKEWNGSSLYSRTRDEAQDEVKEKDS